MQPLASSVGLGTTARLGARKNLPFVDGCVLFSRVLTHLPPLPNLALKTL
jgi:hypothetical protein